MSRGAFITAVVTAVIALALNPVSILVGYYLSKSLAAPKLTIEYIKPIVQTEALLLDKSTITKMADALVSGYPALINEDPSDYECSSEPVYNSISFKCADAFQKSIPDNIDGLNEQAEQLKLDIKAVSAWNGKTALSLPTLYFTGEQPFDFAFLNFSEKNADIAFLNEKLAAIETTVNLDKAGRCPEGC